MSADWNDQIAVMAQRWSPIAAASEGEASDWKERASAMRAEQRRLQQQGRWNRGVDDLLTICGVHRKEAAHTKAVRWLCDSSESHGLGSHFLAGLLNRTGGVPESIVDAEAWTEVAEDLSRADVVVAGKSWTLVIELKVNAGESETQCQRLYDDWRSARDPRFVFVTLSGRPPTTTTTETAAQAWRSLSWADILAVLDDAVVAGAAMTLEAPAVAEYRRTLRRLTGRRRR